MTVELLQRGQPWKVIASDPPWMERGGGRIKRGADRHYDLLTYAEIVDATRCLMQPEGVDREGCALWLWSTSNHLPGAFGVMESLGFRYVTHLVWTKTGKPGLGQRTRHRHEHLLLGTVGHVPIPPPPDRPDSVMEAPRAKHSEKPQVAYDRIERAMPWGPKLELFARAPRAGWTTRGDDPGANE
jgi:N6-adenosine-specific RNA methylase IME4